MAVAEIDTRTQESGPGVSILCAVACLSQPQGQRMTRGGNIGSDWGSFLTSQQASRETQAIGCTHVGESQREKRKEFARRESNMMKAGKDMLCAATAVELALFLVGSQQMTSS